MPISRRSFLKGTLAGGVGVAASGLMAPLRVFAEDQPAAAPDAASAVESPKSWRDAPAPIPQDQLAEIYISDIVIVGAGNAGMAAGMRAVERGASVTIVEKLSAVGASRSSFAAIDSRMQKAAGISLNKHEVVEELCKYASHRVDQKLIRLWANESGATMDWLADLMAQQGYEMIVETDCGNEDHGFYKTFPVCHNLQSVYEGDEPVPYMADASVHPEIAMHLVEPFTAAGGQILFNTPMQQLILNEAGRVIGVVCKDADGDYVGVYARKGVMICTGGYAYNEDMMRDMNPQTVAHCTTMEAYPGNNGDGIKAATWIGADKDDVPTVMVFDRGGVPSGVGGGGLYANSGVMTHIGSQPFLKVNHDGERFCNKSVPYDYIYHAATKEKLSTYCMIFDANWREQTRQFHTIGCSRMQLSPSGSKYILSTEDFQEFFFQNILMPAGICVEADTIEGLAEKLLIPADALRATVDRYNELCAKGVDEDFGKESYRMMPIDTPPYRAVTLGGQLLCTLDGLRINTQMQVLDRSGEVIDGLYAGGNDSGGFFSNCYPELVVGIAMGRTFTFARLAGENMAAAEAADLGVSELRKQKKEIVGGDGNGTYTVTRQGMGDVTVTCTFNDSKLIDVQIVGDGETKGYGLDAIPVLRETLLSAETPEIDAVSGSTITSNAVISAVKECFQMAGVAF